MKRILVRAPNWIGDQILAYPFYRILRDRYPKAWIAVVCSEWVKEIQFKGLVDEIFVLPRRRNEHTLRSAWKLFRFARFLKKKGPWDLSFLLPNSFGSALVFRLAGARARRGYIADARGWLLNEGIPFDPTRSVHRSEAYLRLLTPEGSPGFEAVDFWVKGPERDFDPYVRWPEVKPFDPPEERYFIVAPGSNAEARRWGTGQFAQLIDEVVSRHRFLPVVVGGPAEKSLAEAFRRRGIGFEDYTGKGSVASLWKLFQRAEFAVCNDSGLAHVASLCGCPVQIVWGAGDPKRTRPIGPGPVQLKIHP
ncbi:MAG: glycosyltransferase family 9 protein, partial [Proteobacteria bacterium]|nr:glycosyltransferase family 9 protein [Pseudomonadota bacterium]